MYQFKTVITGNEVTRIVLVTGGRDFIPGPSDYAWIAAMLLPGTKLIHGACPTGADIWAHEFALGLGFIDIKPYPADWATHGKAAGPKRNRQMLAVLLVEQKPSTVLAFKGNRGTADMVKIARAAGVQVIEVF
jgi:hypothetical protein